MEQQCAVPPTPPRRNDGDDTSQVSLQDGVDHTARRRKGADGDHAA